MKTPPIDPVNVHPSGLPSSLTCARLTQNPEQIRLGDYWTSDYRDPRARAFSLLGAGEEALVLSTARTHPFIFHALAALAWPEEASASVRATLRRGGPAGLLGDYGVRTWPRALTEEDLAWFRGHHVGDLGKMRQRTHSGRVWLRVPGGNVGGTDVSVFSFWVPSDQVEERDLARLCECFGLEGASPVYVEAIDSTCPRRFSPPGKTR